ncbi:TPA: macrolide ABC transporter ATP-binding protein [Candidatus Uhrbacteria bacterium]|nr:macrolide ABC transporter ATP-binding protein [Candidatus Uhrbacteria bacterium]
MIELHNVGKNYENDGVVTPALAGVTLNIEEGEFVALMGPSGSGKSTLMHILGFLDHLTEGEYRFKGEDVSNLEKDALAMHRRKDVGFVFQFFNLLAKSSVLENVMLPLIYAEVPKAERIKLATKALESVGLGHRLKHLSNQLSGGERQRVAIARAIVHNPAVIFADEPTGNLDTKSGEAILKIFHDLHKAGHTIIMVTHELEAAENAERIVKIRDGKVISDTKNHQRRFGAYHK